MKTDKSILRRGIGDSCFMACMAILAIMGIIGFVGYKVYKDEVSRNRVKRLIDKKFAEEKVIEGEVATVTLSPDHTSVTFTDKRAKEFKGVSPKPVQVGKYVVITYNQDNEVLEVVHKSSTP